MARENGIHKLRDDSFVVANYAAKELFARAQFVDQIGAQFVFNGDARVTALLKLTKSPDLLNRGFWTTHKEPCD
jgi:hypothetical protein